MTTFLRKRFRKGFRSTFSASDSLRQGSRGMGNMILSGFAIVFQFFEIIDLYPALIQRECFFGNHFIHDPE